MLLKYKYTTSHKNLFDKIKGKSQRIQGKAISLTIGPASEGFAADAFLTNARRDVGHEGTP